VVGALGVEGGKGLRMVVGICKHIYENKGINFRRKGVEYEGT